MSEQDKAEAKHEGGDKGHTSADVAQLDVEGSVGPKRGSAFRYLRYAAIGVCVLLLAYVLWSGVL